MVEHNDDKPFLFLKPDTERLYEEMLSFLEEVIERRGVFHPDISKERPIDVLCLNFTKVVNDTKAIMILCSNGFYIQAGIICRSAIDACHLMMHIAFSGENAELVDPWLGREKLTHWKVLENIDNALGAGLDLEAYRAKREMLDDLVHGNYESLKYYPAQSPGPTPMTTEAFNKIVFWRSLLNINITSCLLVVNILVPEFAEKAEQYLELLRVT